MDIRKLGRSGLKVTNLCLGTMTFGIQAEKETAFAILDKALDSGVFFIDTADVYPLGGGVELAGKTESIVGEWLENKRDQIVLATKCFGNMGDGPNERGLSRKHVIAAVEDSLRRLRTDYIDLYQAHQYDDSTPLDETLRAWDDLVTSGKVRYIGVSNWRAWQIAKANGIAERKDFVRIDCDQPRYNLLFRMIEDDLVPMCLDEGVGIISYNPLAGGVLTGRYRPGAAVQSGTRFGLQNAGPMYQERYWKDTTFEVVEQYRTWCSEHGYDMTTTAVKWVTQQPGITSAIIGASRPEQLDASLRAGSVPDLTADDLAWLDQLWYTLPRRKELR